mgnify:CR=1 FL=1
MIHSNSGKNNNNNSTNKSNNNHSNNNNTNNNNNIGVDLFPENINRNTNRNIEAFKKHLFDKGYITTLRITRGDDIDGACGQLVGNLKKATKGKKIVDRQAIA